MLSKISQAAKIIKQVYEMNHLPTVEETELEITTLAKKDYDFIHDDTQRRLYSRLESRGLLVQ